MRRDLDLEAKETLRGLLARGLREGWDRMAEFALERRHLDITAAEVAEYLHGFSFQVGPPERQAIQRFRELLGTVEDNADTQRQASRSS